MKNLLATYRQDFQRIENQKNSDDIFDFKIIPAKNLLEKLVF